MSSSKQVTLQTSPYLVKVTSKCFGLLFTSVEKEDDSTRTFVYDFISMIVDLRLLLILLDLYDEYTVQVSHLPFI